MEIGGITKDYFVYDFPLNFTVAGQAITVPRRLLSGGDFELRYIVSNHANEFFFNIFDTASNQRVFNDQISSVCVSGDGQYPFVLPVSRLFGTNHTVRIEATNGAVAANPGSLLLVGATVRSGATIDVTPGEFSVYGTAVNFGLAGQTVTAVIDVLNEKAFEVYGINMSHNRALSWTFQITDNATGKTLFANPVDVRSIAGTGMIPGIIPITQRFRGKSSITITATNDPAGGAHGGQVILYGANRW